jgi:hypothetical protein
MRAVPRWCILARIEVSLPYSRVRVCYRPAPIAMHQTSPSSASCWSVKVSVPRHTCWCLSRTCGTSLGSWPVWRRPWCSPRWACCMSCDHPADNIAGMGVEHAMETPPCVARRYHARCGALWVSWAFSSLVRRFEAWKSRVPQRPVADITQHVSSLHEHTTVTWRHTPMLKTLTPCTLFFPHSIGLSGNQRSLGWRRQLDA